MDIAPLALSHSQIPVIFYLDRAAALHLQIGVPLYHGMHDGEPIVPATPDIELIYRSFSPGGFSGWSFVRGGSEHHRYHFPLEELSSLLEKQGLILEAMVAALQVQIWVNEVLDQIRSRVKTVISLQNPQLRWLINVWLGKMDLYLVLQNHAHPDDVQVTGNPGQWEF